MVEVVVNRKFWLIDKDDPTDKRRVHWVDMLAYMNDTSLSTWTQENFDFVRYAEEMDEIDFKFVIENAKGDEFWPFSVGEDGSIDYTKQDKNGEWKWKKDGDPSWVKSTGR